MNEAILPLQAPGVAPRGNVTIDVCLERLGRLDAVFSLKVNRPGGGIKMSRREKLADLHGFLAPGGTGMPEKLYEFLTTNLMGDPPLSKEALCHSVGHVIMSQAIAHWDRTWEAQQDKGDGLPSIAKLPDHETVTVCYRPLAWGEWIATITDCRKADREPQVIRLSLEGLRRHLDRTPEALPEAFVALAKDLAPKANAKAQIIKVGTQILNGAPEKAR